jgi:ABC-type nitrate/sulfonate/bicarbonate transport system substrate-binding protein/LysM repeat protein
MVKTRREHVSAASLLLIGLFPLFASYAAEKQPAQQSLERVRIVYAGLSGNQAPGWAAYEGGFFRKQGLDAELVHVVGGGRAVQTLLSGDVPFAQVSGLPVLESSLQGSGIVILAGLLNTMNYQFIVASDIKQPSQLKGKTLAVSRVGSSSDFATRYALDRYGLVPGKDVSIIEIGSQPERFAALGNGKIHGVMLEVPLTLRAKKMGFSVLADLQMLGLEYQATVLATTQAMIKSRPDLVRKVLTAYVEGIHYYKTNRRDGLAILEKHLKTDDVEALTETYENIGLTLIPEKPYPTLRGIQIMLQELSTREPKAQSARPEQFVNLLFLRELDSSGFIDRLYKATPALSIDRKPKVAAAPPPGPAEKKVVARAPAPAASKPPAEGEEYTIQPGDTLSKLAGRFYGAIGKWPKIYEANTRTIKNPDYIYIGQKIVIPSS